MHALLSLPVMLPALVLLLGSAPARADIYAYTDKNGVRHISNRPDDARYKLVMRTPKYRKPPVAAAPETAAPETAAVDAEGGWKVLRPSGSGAQSAAAAALGGDNYVLWGGGRLGRKPFRIDEKRRRALSGHIARIAARHRVDPHLLHAVISAESAFDPRAVSHAGAMGLMQLMPATAKRFGVRNPFDPVANINGGARYLRWLLTHFRNNVQLALAGYNAGEGAVKKYGNRIPPYKETQTYVRRVLQFYHHFRNNRS